MHHFVGHFPAFFCIEGAINAVGDAAVHCFTIYCQAESSLSDLALLYRVFQL